eukprot:SAG31_NODE_2895_length_4940_cov_4.688494_7_plen_169_part_00
MLAHTSTTALPLKHSESSCLLARNAPLRTFCSTYVEPGRTILFACEAVRTGVLYFASVCESFCSRGGMSQCVRERCRCGSWLIVRAHRKDCSIRKAFCLPWRRARPSLPVERGSGAVRVCGSGMNLRSHARNAAAAIEARQSRCRARGACRAHLALGRPERSGPALLV